MNKRKNQIMELQRVSSEKSPPARCCFLFVLLLRFVFKRFLKNPDLHTAPNNQVFKPNCSRYLSDLGFLKTNSMIFSTFSRWSDGGLITKE